jgi:hypothetical protein
MTASTAAMIRMSSGGAADEPERGEPLLAPVGGQARGRADQHQDREQHRERADSERDPEERREHRLR